MLHVVFVGLLSLKKEGMEPVSESDPKKQRIEEYNKEIQEKELIKHWCDDLNDIIGRGLQPLIQAMGGLAVKLRIPHGDIRFLMQYDERKISIHDRIFSIVKPANNIEEFMRVNRELGSQLLATYLDSVMPTKYIKPQITKPKEWPVKDEEPVKRVKTEQAKTQIVPIEAHQQCFDLRDFDSIIEHQHQASQREEYAVDIHDAEIRFQAAEAAAFSVEQEIRGFLQPGQVDDIDTKRRDQETKRLEIMRLEELFNKLQEQMGTPGLTGKQSGIIRKQRDETRDSLNNAREELHRLNMKVVEYEHKSERLQTRLRAAYAARDEANRVLDEMRRIELVLDRVNRERDKLEHVQLEHMFAPAWAYNVLADSAVRNVLSASTWAAFEMGHAHIRRIPGCASYTLRELVCSAQVCDKFLFIVAYAYLSSGDHIGYTTSAAQPHARGTGHTAREYINVQKIRDSLRREVMVANVWFETQTRAVRNPLLDAFDTKCDLFRRAQLPDAAWERKMKQFRESLPQREIVFVP